jgi:quinol monooxygenase YgiN
MPPDSVTSLGFAEPPVPPGSTGLAGPASSGLPGPPPGPPARPHGRIQIFTLLEDRVADFDRLAEQLAEEVLAEPDTLVFVVHLVPNAPMQRIFYEVYRDRDAFDRHEDQPYVRRFAADRRPCVLATNVIELRLKYAKVAPLPGPQPSARAPQADTPQAQAPQVQALEPLPPRPEPTRPELGADQRARYAQRSYGGS